MNIKFPKEEKVILEKIYNAILEKDYNTFLNYYNEVIKHANFYNKYYSSLLNVYVETLFEIKQYDKLIMIVEELRKQNIENCMWYFYVIIYLISQKDFYYAKSIITKSKLLSTDSIKYLINEDDANYNSIISMHLVLLSTVGPCLIIINFLNELLTETLKNDVDDTYILMRFFELLNLLYEYGLDKEIIDIFIKSLEILYEIKIE